MVFCARVSSGFRLQSVSDWFKSAPGTYDIVAPRITSLLSSLQASFGLTIKSKN
jgi:hypothetical protein